MVTIQATWRMFKIRRAFLAQRKAKAATLIQSFVRMQQQRKRFRFVYLGTRPLIFHDVSPSFTQYTHPETSSFPLHVHLPVNLLVSNDHFLPLCMLAVITLT